LQNRVGPLDLINLPPRRPLPRGIVGLGGGAARVDVIETAPLPVATVFLLICALLTWDAGASYLGRAPRITWRMARRTATAAVDEVPQRSKTFGFR
jgi:hypothetical protein